MMRFVVHAFGVHYADFNQQADAVRYARDNSSEFQNNWWEIRAKDGQFIEAWKAGDLVRTA